MANADGDITLKIGVVADDARKVASDLHKYMEKTLNKPIDTKAFDGIKKTITETAVKSEKLSEELRTLKSTGADLGFNEQFKQLSESANIAQKKYFALRREAKAMRQAGNIPGAEELEKQVAIADAQRRQLLSQRMTLANTGRATGSDEFKEKTAQLTELNNQMVLYIKQLERMRSLEATRKQVASATKGPEKATPKKGLSETEDKARVLMESIEQLRHKLEGADKSISFLKMDKSIQKTIDDTNALKSTFEQMRAEVYKVTPTEEFAQASAKVKTLQQDVEKYHTKLMELEEMGKTHTQPYTDTVFKWNQAQNSLITQLQLMRQMTAAGEDYNRVLWTETEEYNAAITKQQQLNRDLEIGKQKLKESAEYQTYRDKHVSTPQDVKKEGEEAQQTSEKLNELEGQKQRTTRANSELGEESEETASKMRHEKSAAERLKKAFVAFGQGVKTIGKGMVTVAKATGNFVSRLRGTHKSTNDVSKSLKNLLKFSLKYFLGLRSIFILYKRIRSAGVEAYKGLASQFPELKAEVDELKIAFFQLKNSLATMAQPILSYLVPAIKTLMGWLVAAMNALANFFAILTGQKYIYKATKSNNALANSMKGAGKAAKEANEDIAEYDNLILIQQENDSGGGGSGDADQYAGAWEKVAAESDFAERLKEAIDGGDWEGVGKLFAEKLNNLVARLDNWIVGTLYPKGKEWASNIGRIINGFVDDFNAVALGTLIADAINSAADIANTFLTTTNFEKLGKRVGEAISTAIKKIDIKLLAEALANRLNAAIDFMAGLLGQIHFDQIGQKLADGIVKFFNTVKWKQLGLNVHNLVTGVFDGITTFLQTSDTGHLLANTVREFLSGVQWSSIFNSAKGTAKAFMTAFFDFVTSVNWNEVLNTVSSNMADMVNGLISFIAKAIKVAPWDDIADALASLIENIDWTQILTSAADLAGKLINVAIKLVKALATALLTINWYDVADAIANAIANINWGDVLATLGIAALSLIKAFGSAIAGLITNPDALLSIAEGLALFFGAKFIWTKVAGAIATGLGGAITTGVATATTGTAVGTAAGAVGGFFKRVFTTALGTGGAGTVGSILQGAIGGAVTFQGVGSIYGNVNSVLADAIFNDPALTKEYQEFSKNAIGYTKDTFVAVHQAIREDSYLTGGSIMGNALKDLFSGGDYIDEQLNTYLEGVNKTVDENFQKYLDMLEERVRKGKAIREEDKQLLADYRGYVQQIDDELIDSSNHYVEIAKQNAKDVNASRREAEESSNHYAAIAQQNAEKHIVASAQMEQASNHHAEIAKANAGVVSESQKSMEDASNHYVEIAKKNAEEIINTSVQAQETSNHYVAIAKQNSGYYDKIQKEMEASSNHYVEIAKKNSEAVVKDTQDSTTKMEYALSTVPDFYETTFGQAATNVTNAFSGMGDFFSQTADGVKKPFSTMATFFHDTFSDAWTGAVDVFDTRQPQFKSIQDSISGSFKTMINGMITGVNNSIANPFTTLKNLISSMKNMTVGDSKIFANLPTINVPKIPKLAQGAVLPANSPFLAVVGDQKQGTNIETPLDTMIEAFRIAMQDFGGTNNNQPIVLTLNGKQVAQAVWDEENKRYKQTGVRYKYS